MGGSFVATPSITSPTSGEIDDTPTPTIVASAFVAFGGITHAATDWEVASDSGFSSVIWSSLNNTSNLTTITTGNLGGGTRYVRCRYKSNTGLWSSWSTSIDYTSPWVTGSNLTITTPTNADVNATTTVTFQTGTYRITLWGAAGGKGSGAGGAAGAGGSVRKTVTYPSPAPVTITIGQGGGEGERCDPTQPSGPTNCSGGGAQPGPGYGAGGGGGYFTNPLGTWMGGGGGGSSHFDGMIAGGGGGGMAGGSVSPVGGGGQATGGGGCNTFGAGGSGGTNGGGGGAGAHVSGGATGACEAGEGGNNSGSFDDEWDASGSTVANPYSSPAYGRTFGSANGGAGGGRIEKM